MKRDSLIVAAIIIVLGRIYPVGSNVLIIAVTMASLCAGANMAIVLLAGILGSIWGWYCDTALNINEIYPVFITMFIVLLLVNSKISKVTKSTSFNFIIRLCMTVTYGLAQWVFVGSVLSSGILAGVAVVASFLLEDGLYRIRTASITKSSKEEYMSVMIIVMAFVYGLPDYANEMISVKLLICMFIAVYITYCNGVGYGMVAGVCVISMVASSVEQLFMYVTITAFSVMVASFFREWGKTICAMTYMVSMVAGYVLILIGYTRGAILTNLIPGSAMFAGLLFVLLPFGKRINHGKVSGIGVSDFESSDVRRTTKSILSNMSHEFAKLAQRMQIDAREGEDEGLTDELAMSVVVSVCNICDKKDYCWGCAYNDTLRSINSVAWQLIWKGEVKSAEETVFLNECANAQALIDTAYRGAQNIKKNIQMSNQIKWMREAMGLQMREIANIIGDYANNMFEPVKIGYAAKLKIIKGLYKLEVVTEGLSLMARKDGRYVVKLSCYCLPGKQVSVGKIGWVISRGIGKRLVAVKDEVKYVEQKKEVVTFVEKTNYKIMTGVATTSKNKGEINGDNYSFLQTGDKNVVMMIADGMGTGDEAFAASNQAIEILEDFTMAGFKTETSVQLLNSVMLCNYQGEKSTTIDLCRINRYTGICNFTKVGSAVSFIKRRKEVEIVDSQNCPVGIVDNAWCDTVVKKLYDGDMVIMMSDGVLDAAGDDGDVVLKQFICGMNTANAQEMADEIMNFCCREDDKKNKDDMTVLVAGIWG